MRKYRWGVSLKTKISLMVVVLVVAFSTLAVYAQGNLVEKQFERNKKETISGLLTEQTNEFVQMLNAASRSADVIPLISEVQRFYGNDKNRDPERLTEELKDFSLGRGFASLFLTDEVGKVLVSTDPVYLNNNYSFRTYMKEALAGRPFSEMVIGVTTKQPGFFFSRPLYVDQKVVGAVVVKLDPVEMFQKVLSSPLRNYGDVHLVNSDGVIIFSSKESFIYKSLGELSEKDLEEIKSEKKYLSAEITPLDYDEALESVLADKDSDFIDIYDEEDKKDETFGVRKIGNYPYFLMSEVDKRDILAAVSEVSKTLVLVVGIAAFLGILVQVLYMFYALSPLSKVEDYASKVAGGELDAVLKINTRDELESLSESITVMVGKLKESLRSLEQKVAEKTLELSKNLETISEKNKDLEDSKKALINVMEDLNEEKEKIANDRNRLETILRSIGDGVFVTDNKGMIRLVNQAAEKMVGVSGMEMKGKRYSEVFKFRDELHPEKKYPDFVGEAIKHGQVTSLLPYTVLLDKDGKEVPVLDSAAPIKTLDGQMLGCVVVFRDNTQERELEKSKDDFISVASHQLRTPLGSMRWNLEMIKAGDLGKVSKDIAEVIDQIYEADVRMVDLVDDLLNVSRIDQNRVIDAPEEVDVAEMFEKIVAETKPIADVKGVKVSLAVDKKVKKIYIDQKRMREVMENIVSNGIKYNHKKGTVKISVSMEGECLRTVISDTGIGIPKADLGRLFGKFFRATNAVHSETEGSGLGLYVVKKFVESWGGKVAVKSTEGVGSEFTIVIPINKNIKVIPKK